MAVAVDGGHSIPPLPPPPNPLGMQSFEPVPRKVGGERSLRGRERAIGGSVLLCQTKSYTMC